jgi:hypothetical protein
VLVERNGHGGLLSAENDVGGVCGRLVFGDAEAERRQVNPGEHCFALPEHDGGQGQMQLVDQSRAKILTHRLDAAADLHVATIGGLLRLIQRRLDTLGHKDEGGQHTRHAFSKAFVTALARDFEAHGEEGESPHLVTADRMHAVNPVLDTVNVQAALG